jgi:hypothetical protein
MRRFFSFAGMLTAVLRHLDTILSGTVSKALHYALCELWSIEDSGTFFTHSPCWSDRSFSFFGRVLE